MEDRTSNDSYYKNVILERKRIFNTIIWFYRKLSIELWRYITNFDSSIIDAIDDFKTNGPTTLRMHQLYGFSQYQNPTVLGLFGYKSLPVWDISSIKSLLESNISLITAEFAILKNNCLNFEKLKANSKINNNNSTHTSWRVYHLIEEGLRNETNLLHCPTVSKVLDNLNICACSLGYAYFSVLSAKTIIEPHYGVTNVKLRIQIPLLNQPNIHKCQIKINHQDYYYESGKVIIFDDSYLHSVSNDSDEERVVLLIDIWHPDLSQHTIQILTNYFYNGSGLAQTNLSFNKPDHFIDHNTPQLDKRNFDYLFKFLMIGQNGVGKSSLLLRYAENYFTDSYISTIGVDFKIKKVQIRDKVIKFQIWDPAGPERFRTITTGYYRGAHVILILVDLADPFNTTEFEHITDHWYQGVLKNTAENATIVLVGTKADLKDKRVISYERILKYANNNKIPYFETSSKDNINVSELFITAARIRYQKIMKDTLPGKVVVNKSEEVNKKSSCVVY